MESDMFNKQQEFYLWLQEVKKTNPETLPRFEMKKMFDTFAEDYNTVTLPHKKYGFSCCTGNIIHEVLDNIVNAVLWQALFTPYWLAFVPAQKAIRYGMNSNRVLKCDIIKN